MSAYGRTGGSGRTRVGVVVVHGVGDTEPGYCVNAVLETLAATKPGYSVSQSNEYNRVAEASVDHPPLVSRSFAGPPRHKSGLEIEAVEVHWADLTAMGPGGSTRCSGCSASSSNPITSSTRCSTGRSASLPPSCGRSCGLPPGCCAGRSRP